MKERLCGSTDSVLAGLVAGDAGSVGATDAVPVPLALGPVAAVLTVLLAAPALTLVALQLAASVEARAHE